MVKLSRCPLTSQEHDSATAVRRGERSKEGKRDRSEESWRRNVGIDARSIRPWRGGRPFRGELVRKTRYNTAHGNSGSVTFVARWDTVRGRDAAPRAVHLPGRICTGVLHPLERGHSCCLPFVPFASSFFLHPFSRRNWTSGTGRGFARPLPLPVLPFLPPSLCIFHPRNSINAPRWSSSLSTSFHRNSNLPGILRRWKLNFFS